MSKSRRANKIIARQQPNRPYSAFLSLLFQKAQQGFERLYITEIKRHLVLKLVMNFG